MDFSNQKLGSLYRSLIKIFKEGNIEPAEKETRIILQQRTSYKWEDIITNPDIIINPDQIALINKDVEQRLLHVPLSRLYGQKEFWGLNFRLSPDTLDPRPDTEVIIDLAKKRLTNKAPELILDLGTGTGCILIALLHEFKNAFGVGVDFSDSALRTASGNAQLNNVAERSSFCCSNWALGIEGKFDLIVSNPPYISNQIIPKLDPEVRNHDPILALDGGKDGLDAYRKIFSSLKNNLKSSGLALFEIGFDQEESVSRLVEDHGFLLLGVHRDLAGQPRVVEISCGDK